MFWYSLHVHRYLLVCSQKYMIVQGNCLGRHKFCFKHSVPLKLSYVAVIEEVHNSGTSSAFFPQGIHRNISILCVHWYLYFDIMNYFHHLPLKFKKISKGLIEWMFSALVWMLVPEQYQMLMLFLRTFLNLYRKVYIGKALPCMWIQLWPWFNPGIHVWSLKYYQA